NARPEDSVGRLGRGGSRTTCPTPRTRAVHEPPLQYRVPEAVPRYWAMDLGTAGGWEGDVEEQRSASREAVGGNWPRYDAAALGFRNYWYPVLLSSQLGSRPRAITLC